MKIQASGQDAGAVARHAAIGIDRFFNSPSEAGLTSSPPRVAHALAPIGPHTPEPAGQTRTSGLPGVMPGASVPRFYRKWVVGRLVGTPRKSENSLMISIFKGSPLRSHKIVSIYGIFLSFYDVTFLIPRFDTLVFRRAPELHSRMIR
jgi:hypothetical protein